MAEEVSEAFKMSYTLMQGNAALVAIAGERIYQHQAPERVFDLGDIYIIGDYMAGSEVTGGFGARLMTEPLILWRAVKRGQLNDQLRTADREMDSVLQNIRAVVSGGFVFSAVRERPHYRTTRDQASNSFTELGGTYRYFVSSK